MQFSAPITIEPASDTLSDSLRELRQVAGVYLMTPLVGTPHLGWSSNLARRLGRLLSTPDDGATRRAAQIRSKLKRIDCYPTGSRLESALLLYQLARRLFPASYVRQLRLRYPWFVGLTSEDTFPRLHTVDKIPDDSAIYYGPFPNRATAQHYEAEVLGLFAIRRCTERLHPSPEHPGCMYGEMNQCVRPCQGAVSEGEYDTEVARVRDFLKNNGRSAMASLASARERASEELQFEAAAQIHKRIDRMRAAAQLREGVVNDAFEFGGVALTASARKGSWVLWPMVGGFWQKPVELDFVHEEAQEKSMDAQLRELLMASLRETTSEGTRSDNLAIFSRWYYSSWRDGEWFPCRTVADLNYRKLVRAISKLTRPPVPAEV